MGKVVPFQFFLQNHAVTNKATCLRGLEAARSYEAAQPKLKIFINFLLVMKFTNTIFTDPYIFSKKINFGRAASLLRL